MTDNVIEFKPKTVENTDNEDIYFGIVNDGAITNTGVIGWPLDGICCPKEYLVMCKRDLEDEDYRDVLCGIIDIDIYHELDTDLQRIVETYYTYTGTDLLTIVPHSSLPKKEENDD
jgi:hypothetical protein